MVQHFTGRYSRYSRYRTKTHDKSTISHDISRYSRYQTVFLKLQEIICFISYTKSSAMQGFLCFIFTRIIAKDFGNRTPSVILSGAKIPIGHPRASSPLPRFFASLENDREWAAPRRILIGIFAKSKFCGSRMRILQLVAKKAHRSKQNRKP